MLVSEFVAAVRRQGQIPADFTDAMILAAGDMEIQGRLVPLIRQSHNEYFVSEVQATSYNGRVALPPRSIAGTVRHVQLMTGGVTQRLPMVALEDDKLGQSGSLPTGWYFDGGAIILLPRGCDATVRLRYYLRPSKMAVETDATKFLVISTATQSSGGYNVVTVSNSSTLGALVDVVNIGAAHEFDAIDVASVAATTTPISSTLTLNQIIAGSYLCKAGYTPFVPLPEELFAALVHQVSMALLRALGYDAEASAQSQLAEKSLEEGRTLLAPRSEGNPKRIRGGTRRSLNGYRR
jgi:hypothetical protein